MPEPQCTIRYRSIPIQILSLGGSVVLRRGMIQVTVSGEEAHKLVTQLISVCTNGVSLADILEHFEEEDRPSVTSLLDFLVSRKLLLKHESDSIAPFEDEQPTDIFYWHFDSATQQTRQRFLSIRIVVIGTNRLGREIVTALNESEFGKVRVVDHPDLNDGELPLSFNGTEHRPITFDQWHAEKGWNSADCVVAASDIGALDHFHKWNQICVEHNLYFLPVILDNIVGQLGPLVIPGETACYECLTSRENSQMNDVSLRRAIQAHSPEGRHVLGYHRATCSIVGNLAAFEIMRAYSKSFPGLQAGAVTELNIVTSDLKRRKVLKVPRCGSCSSMRTLPSLSPYKSDVIAEG